MIKSPSFSLDSSSTTTTSSPRPTASIALTTLSLPKHHSCGLPLLVIVLCPIQTENSHTLACPNLESRFLCFSTGTDNTESSDTKPAVRTICFFLLCRFPNITFVHERSRAKNMVEHPRPSCSFAQVSEEDAERMCRGMFREILRRRLHRRRRPSGGSTRSLEGWGVAQRAQWCAGEMGRHEGRPLRLLWRTGQ